MNDLGEKFLEHISCTCALLQQRAATLPLCKTFGTPTHGWMLQEEATYTTTSPAVIPGEHHLDRDETLVTLPGMGEHRPALLLNGCCHLLLWHCSVVHCQCGSTL